MYGSDRASFQLASEMRLAPLPIRHSPQFPEHLVFSSTKTTRAVSFRVSSVYVVSRASLRLLEINTGSCRRFRFKIATS